MSWGPFSSLPLNPVTDNTADYMPLLSHFQVDCTPKFANLSIWLHTRFQCRVALSSLPSDFVVSVGEQLKGAFVRNVVKEREATCSMIALVQHSQIQVILTPNTQARVSYMTKTCKSLKYVLVVVVETQQRCCNSSFCLFVYWADNGTGKYDIFSLICW